MSALLFLLLLRRFGKVVSRVPKAFSMCATRSMTLRLSCSLLVGMAAVVSADVGQAQEWATKMFAVTSHNFGTVARGS